MEKTLNSVNTVVILFMFGCKNNLFATAWF